MKKIKVSEHSIDRFFERIFLTEPAKSEESRHFIKNIILTSLTDKAFALGFGDYIIKDYNAIAIIRNYTVLTIIAYEKKNSKKQKQIEKKKYKTYVNGKTLYKKDRLCKSKIK